MGRGVGAKVTNTKRKNILVASVDVCWAPPKQSFKVRAGDDESDVSGTLDVVPERRR